MKIFVTGATGFIGLNLVKKLTEQGHTVHALYRSEAKAAKLRKNRSVKLFKGTITQPETLKKGIKGCRAVFHLAAFAKVWAKKNDTFYQINYTGTQNVIDAAQKAGVEKIVVTSTAGVLGPSQKQELVTEKTQRKVPYFTGYEATKAESEKLIAQKIENGQHIVIVNPTRVYGPGILSDSNGVTKMIWLYCKGKFRTLPGNGKSIGNYVFIDDVVQGHILALEKGKPGERYALGGENVSYRRFFQTLARLSGKKYKMFPFPLFLMLAAAQLMLWAAKILGTPPLITPQWVRKYNYNWAVSSQKAENELGYSITPLETGIKKTLDFLKQKNR